MGWLRRNKFILSALFTLVFAVFTFYYPLFSNNIVEKGSKACKTLNCSSVLFNGGQIAQSERSYYKLFVKKPHLDKIVTKIQAKACILVHKKHNPVELFSPKANLLILELNCILRI